MACFSGPEIPNDGLVFCYDQGNTDKSWKGAPTTNLAKNASNVVDWSVSGLTQSVARSTIVANEVYRITSTSLTGTSFRIRFDNATLVNGSTYTVSYKYKIISGGTQFIANDWCDTSITRTTTALANNTFYETATGTRATYDSTYRFLDLEMSNNTVVEIYDLQLEERSFATPYTSTQIRTNTQALLDMTGQNTITANSLTYASNGSFSFGGSDRLNFTLSGSASSTAYTRIVWIKPTQSTADTKSVMLNQIGNNSDMAVGIENNKAVFHQYTRTNTSGTTDGDYTASGSTTLSTNNIYMIAVTVNRNISTNNINIYLNGLLDGTASLALGAASSDNVIIGGPANDVYGGARMFYGDCYIAAHYDRALTALEVKQNFEASRGRYGI
jgi:hypothetical protein